MRWSLVLSVFFSGVACSQGQIFSELPNIFKSSDLFAGETGFFLGIFLLIAFFHYSQFFFEREMIDLYLGAIATFALSRILIVYGGGGSLSLSAPYQMAIIRSSFLIDMLIILAGFLFVSEFSLVYKQVNLKETFLSLIGLGFLTLLTVFIPKEFFLAVQLLIFLAGGLVISRLIFVTITLPPETKLSYLEFFSLVLVSFALLVFACLDSYTIFGIQKTSHLTEYGFSLYWVPWFLFHRKRKSQFFVSSHSRRLELETKLVELVTAYDLERNKAEKASEIKDKLISVVSHDIRSPMSGISSVLQLLAQDSKSVSPEEFTRILNNSSQSMKNLMKMMEDLIHYSRFQNASILPKYQLFDYGELIQSAKSKIAQQFQDKAQKFLWEPKENSIAMGDPGLLETLIIQLLSNACKFSPARSQIKIALEEKNSQWILTVKDEGIGFPSEWSPIIFDQGFQYLRKGTSEEMGPGVGLVFCKEISDLHGGRLRAESKEWHGALFEFSLPNYSQLVYLLDDNALFRKRLRNELSRFPFVIWESESPEKTISSLEILKPDLIITDYQMPELDGLSLIQKILDHQDLVDVPIVLITSENESSPKFIEIQKKAKVLGFDAFYNKENFINDLPEILKSWLTLN